MTTSILEYVPKLTQIPSDVLCLADYQKLARDFIPSPYWEYIESGTSDELTLKKNFEQWDHYQIMPRVLRDLSAGNTALNLLGLHLAHPIFLAPVAHQKLVHPRGELMTAQGADASDTLMVVSHLANYPLEMIAEHTYAPKWFQLYFHRDLTAQLNLIRRIEQANYAAIVVTVDLPVHGLRYKTRKAGFVLPRDVMPANPCAPTALHPHLSLGESPIFQGHMRQAMTWEDLSWLVDNTHLPVIVKGILHPLDAQQCKQLGASGVVVSNHGGRALDSGMGTAQALSSIRQSVGPRFPLLLDGGVRRGTDVFKALALGADAILLGRPQVFALAVAGATGVAHMLKSLRDELEMTMALTGCRYLTDITQEHVQLSY